MIYVIIFINPLVLVVYFLGTAGNKRIFLRIYGRESV
jgi:hypothetical protein